VKDADGKYELIILHPPHLPIDDHPPAIKHPTTQQFTLFYKSEDGFLHEGSSTGPRLPPFGSGGISDRSVTLNPIPVNFAAAIRLRRLDRQKPEWRKPLHPEANLILQGVSELYGAVYRKPGHPKGPVEVTPQIPFPVPNQSEPC